MSNELYKVEFLDFEECCILRTENIYKSSFFKVIWLKLCQMAFKRNI